MPTYYKYAEREADSYVNWGEIGKSMTDMIKEQNRIRETKKDAIDKASREYGQKLQDPPQGQDKANNEWTLKFANDASKFMLMQDRLLKSGQIGVKDYTLARQNVMDGTERMFNLTKDYQANYAKKMERYKTLQSSGFEPWLMAQAEQFGNFNQSGGYIDPVTGNVTVAMREKQIIDGKEVYVMSNNPNEFTTVSALRDQLNTEYNRFNLDATTETFAKGNGKYISAVRSLGTKTKEGQIMSIEDVMSKDYGKDKNNPIWQFQQAERQWAESQIVNAYSGMSILKDWKMAAAANGQQYDFTYNADEAKANPNLILVRKDPSSGQPTPMLNAEQKEEAINFLITDARRKYDKITDIKTYGEGTYFAPQPPSQASIDEKKYEEEAVNFGKNLGRFISGTEAEKAVAASYFSDRGVVAKQIGNKFYVTGPNGTSEFKSDVSKEVLTRAMVSAMNPPTQYSQQIIVKNALGSGGGSPVSIGANTTISGEKTKIDYTPVVEQLVAKNVGMVDTDNNVKTTANYTSKYSKLGFNFKRVAGEAGGDIDSMEILAPNGSTTTVKVWDNSDAESSINAFIIANQSNEKTEASGLVKKIVPGQDKDKNDRIKKY